MGQRGGVATADSCDRHCGEVQSSGHSVPSPVKRGGINSRHSGQRMCERLRSDLRFDTCPVNQRVPYLARCRPA
jgi:hypothetical protein